MQLIPEFPIDGNKQFHHIPDWYGYCVSNTGDVWSCRKVGRKGGITKEWKRLTIFPHNTKKQYDAVALRRDGKTIVCLVHRLILEAFVGPCPEGMQACHKDDDETNNTIGNLYWGYPINNTQDRRRNEHYHGSVVFTAKLTDDKVLEIRQLYSQGIPQHKIAATFGICQMTVSFIVRRLTWTHI